MSTNRFQQISTAPLPDVTAYRVVPRRYWGRWVATAVIIVLILGLMRAFAHGQIEWAYVGTFLTAPVILDGLLNTVVMAIVAMALGIAFGIGAAIMRMSSNPVLRGVSIGYVWLFRGTPLILQLLLWFNLALVFPTIGIEGIWQVRTVQLMTPALAALLGLSINQGAYMSEIVRAGLLSVDTGQAEAAKAIGMTSMHALRRIIFPQAMRVIIPPLGNEFISMIKLTSLASVIQFTEILHNAQNIYYANSRVIELLIVAAIWYVTVVTVLTPFQVMLERRYARGMRGGR